MPRGDGTGPMGAGAMTGRGLGFCSDANVARYGADAGMRPGFGFGCRRGFGRGGFGRGFGGGFGMGLGGGLVAGQASSKTQKELLEEQKNYLQSRLEVIDKQLEEL